MRSERQLCIKLGLQSMQSWVRWRTRPGTTDGRNPWANALSELRKIRSNAPKKTSASQVWARDHRDKIRELVGPDSQIGEWNHALSILYEAVDAEEKLRCEEIARKEHEIASAQSKDRLKSLPSPESAVQLE